MSDMQKNQYHCFKEYEKVFTKVRHEYLMRMLEQLLYI